MNKPQQQLFSNDIANIKDIAINSIMQQQEKQMEQNTQDSSLNNLGTGDSSALAKIEKFKKQWLELHP